ncbi:MAG: metal ABC transporter permease [Candidatus Dependentiae bacterium]
MNIVDVQIITIALLVAYACTLPGIFLTLRGMALMSDAISHAILPGIVIMFLCTHNLHSPFLTIAASCTGIVTVLLTESLIATKCLKEDAAIGLVFPLFFSVGIILICLYARTVHLDIDMVIMGEIIFAPFDTLYIHGYPAGPHALWNMIVILLINSLFVALCYKELQITTFNKGLASALGFSPLIIQYILMCLTSITCVGTFDIVGSIVVVALIIGPASTAYLISRTLHRMIHISFVAATLSVLLGYIFAYTLDVSIAGSIATMNGLLFLSALLFAPKRGLCAQYISNTKERKQHAMRLLCSYIKYHNACTFDQLADDMQWSHKKCSGIVQYALKEKFILQHENKLIVSKDGLTFLKHALPDNAIV